MSRNRNTGRTTAQAEMACDRLVREAHGSVLRLPRQRSDHAIVPERRYHVHGHVMWWAPRAKRGQLSKAQCDFMRAEHAAGQICGAGDESELRQVLGFLAAGHTAPARGVAWEEFAAAVIQRGLRGTRHGALVQDYR